MRRRGRRNRRRLQFCRRRRAVLISAQIDGSVDDSRFAGKVGLDGYVRVVAVIERLRVRRERIIALRRVRKERLIRVVRQPIRAGIPRSITRKNVPRGALRTVLNHVRALRRRISGYDRIVSVKNAVVAQPDSAAAIKTTIPGYRRIANCCFTSLQIETAAKHCGIARYYRILYLRRSHVDSIYRAAIVFGDVFDYGKVDQRGAR